MDQWLEQVDGKLPQFLAEGASCRGRGGEIACFAGLGCNPKHAGEQGRAALSRLVLAQEGTFPENGSEDVGRNRLHEDGGGALEIVVEKIAGHGDRHDGAQVGDQWFQDRVLAW